MKKVLVTGVSGFTGRYFVDLAGKMRPGTVKIFGVDKKCFPGSPENFKFIRSDLLDKGSISKIIGDTRPDYILHLSALLFSKDHEDLLKYNVLATKNIFDAVIEKGLSPRILVIGTSGEYGISSRNIPLKETGPLAPITPYGLSKAAQTLLALQYHQGYGLDIVIARPFNLIGPGQTSQLVCGSIVNQIKDMGPKGRRKGRLLIGNLHTSRDFIDVRDAVRAYWMLMACKKPVAGEIFNVGSGKPHSVREIVKILSGLCGRKFSVEQRKDKVMKKDIPAQTADITKIKALTGWKPEIPIGASLMDMYLNTP
ncbi:MAG: GDP-mannose 4,6-dehydratase [Candidatus Omnitrophota bacterium]|jgi:GDP-4-dehydro-6-deoxy-D-mannose reductase